MTTKTGITLVAVLVVAIGGLSVLLSQRDADKTESVVIHKDEPIKLGFIAPQTGGIANIGQASLTSAQMAVEEINAAGGVNGRKLELIVEDGQCKPKEGAQAANKLMRTDRVPLAFVMCSPEVAAAAPIAEETKTVVLSGCASAPHITDAGDYIFRTYPSDAFQGVVAAEYAYNTLGKRKVAILALQNDWGIGLAQVFAQKFTELGAEIVATEKVNVDASDLRSQLAKIKNSTADLVYFPAFTQVSINGLKQAKEMGLTLPMLGGDAWDDTVLHDSGAADGVLYLIPNSDYDPQWIRKMEEKDAAITVCAPNAYDNVYITADIIRRVGTDPTKIKDELYKVKDYDGVSGVISIDENGDLLGAQYQVKRVEGTKAIVIE